MVRRTLFTSALALTLVVALQVPVTAHPDHAGVSDPDRASLPAVAENVELVGRLQLPDLREDPEVPRIVGRIADVNYWGDFAYLASYSEPACDQGGVYVVDISDPTNPTYVTFIDAAAGTYVGEGVQVLDYTGLDTDFQGQVLLHNNEDCTEDFTGMGGISYWDVTDPTAPVALSENVGDTDSVDSETGEHVDDGFIHTYHSMFGWIDGDTVYAVGVDNEESEDIDIFDITDPTTPVLVSEFGYQEDPEIIQEGETAPHGDSVFSHDVVVKLIGDQMLMLMCYWDGGYIIIDVTDPANPVALRDTDFAPVEPLAAQFGMDVPLVPEGNAHQGEFSPANDFFLATDEDFAPFRLLGETTEGPNAGFEFEPLQGSDTPTLTEETPLAGTGEFIGLACNNPDGSPAELPQATAPIAIAERGVCFFQEKLDNAAAAGYEAIIVFNSVRSDCLALVNPAVESEDVPFLFVDRATGWELLGLEVDDETVCSTVTPGTTAVSRIPGDDPVSSSVAVSQFAFAPPNDTVVIARADDYADALTGGPLAYAAFAPLLLTGQEVLDAAVAEEITRLEATHAIILGGVDALAPQVETDLQALGLTTERVAGDTRFTTAIAVADRLAEIATEAGLEPATSAFVVEGDDADELAGWPDAVTVAPLAAATGTPILLTVTELLPEPTATALAGYEAVTTIGGVDAISQEVNDEIAGIVGIVDNLSGSDRFGTSAAVANAAAELGVADPALVFLASSSNYADALAIGPVAAAFGGTMLLVNPEDLTMATATQDYLQANLGSTAEVVLVGDISDQVEGQVADIYAAELTSVAFEINPEFDGWGYVHLYDAETMADVDQYVVDEAADPAFAVGFGDLSVHEVAMHPTENRAYVSYYAAGFRVIEFGPTGITEVGAYIHPDFNNLWGVQVMTETAQGGAEPLVLASDRDFGLYIFRYTGP